MDVSYISHLQHKQTFWTQHESLGLLIAIISVGSEKTYYYISQPDILVNYLNDTRFMASVVKYCPRVKKWDFSFPLKIRTCKILGCSFFA